MALLRLLHQSPLYYLQNPLSQSDTKHNTRTPSNNLSISLSLSSFYRLSHYHSRTHTHTNTLSTKTTSVNVSVDTPQLQSETEQEEEEEFSKTRLIAQNVPWTCTPEDIRALFEKHGKVEDVELSMHNKTRNRGLAFVTMGSPEEALAALNNVESYVLEGRALKVNYAKPKNKKPAQPVQPRPSPTFNLFVANLPFDARSKHLKEFFNAEGGNIVSAEVIYYDNPRRSSGYGFVSFKTKKEAEEALSAFQEKIFMGRPIRVARSRQFVKLQAKEGLQSDDASAELKPGEEHGSAAAAH